LAASHPHLQPAPFLPGAAEKLGGARSGRFVSIGIKLALLSVLVVGVATSVAFFYATERERERMLEAKRIAASMVADLLAQSLQAPLDFNDEEAAQLELQHLEQNKEVVYAGVWRAGAARPLVELRAAGPDLPPPTDLQTPRTLAFSDRVEALRTVVGRNHEPVGTAFIQFSLARENAELVVARRNIFLYCLALALGTMGVLILATRFPIVRPLQQLLDAARRTERGEPGGTVEAYANDEIGRLAVAFNAMNAAIFDRERRLSAANGSLRELFDHMRQGIVVFGSDGKVEGTHSRAAAQLFGKTQLEGCDARELLYRDAGHWDAERRAFEEWLPLGFAAPPEAWADVAALAPERVSLVVDGADDRDVLLEFRPVVHDGRVGKIMLLATDESEQRRLEREMERQGALHKSQIAVMRRIVSGGGQQFVAFLEQARRRLARAAELCSRAVERLAPSALGELFQIVHTLRSEAQSFELRELAEVLRAFEEQLSELREPGAVPDVMPWSARHAQLERALGVARALVEQSEELFVQASPLGRAALDNVWVRKSDVTRLVELCAGRSDEIARNVARLAARPFGECVTGVLEQASAWAEREDKRVSVDVEGREALVPPALAEVLGGILAHLVKNAIAHGIEPVAERTSLGKAAVGSIELVCRGTDAESAVLSVADDGRGVAGHSLLAAAVRTQQPLEDLSPALRSTRQHASDLAGRGVGLPAVAAELARVGYALSVMSRGGGGTLFEIRPRAERPI
jgi:two-component system, chemotaxis family, sensor kinase CheA